MSEPTMEQMPWSAQPGTPYECCNCHGPTTRGMPCSECWDGLLRDHEVLLARFAELERERDCYRAVLGGMEFPNLDMLVVKGEAFCAALGQTAKSRIEELSTFGFISAAIAQRGEKNDA